VKNPRVLHVITSLERGGAQTSVVQIVEGLRARGIDAHLAFSSTGGAHRGSPQPLAREASGSGIPLHDISAMRRSPSVFDALATAQLHQLVGSLQPSIVHTHASKAGLLGRAAARLARGPRRIIHSVRGWPWHGRSATTTSVAVSIERQLARITDHFLAVSHAMVAAGLHHGIGRVGDYSVVRSGIELSRFRRRNRDRSAIRGSLGLGDDPLVGTVTRLSAAKAPLDFVAMASTVARAHPRVRFLIVGDGEDRTLVERAIARSGHAARNARDRG
jgi:glycosyltransferase involved in cell wall biosynthesis